MRLAQAASAALAVLLVLALPAPAAAAPPQTAITAGPDGEIARSTVRFELDSDQPGSSFECRLDGATWTLRAPARGRRAPLHVFDPGWAACTSPVTYRHLDDGPHSFEARAIANGETDPTPAARSFTIDTAVAGRARAPRIQRPRRAVGARLAVRAREALEVDARGAIAVRRRAGRQSRYRLAPRSVALEAGEASKLRLRPRSAAAARRIRRDLRHGRRTTANVEVRMTNAAGNSSDKRLLIGLRGPRR